MKMMESPSEDVPVVSGQHDGEAVKVTKVVVKEENQGEVMKELEEVKRLEAEMQENEPIDPMATVCEFDYHVREGVIQFALNVHVSSVEWERAVLEESASWIGTSQFVVMTF